MALHIFVIGSADSERLARFERYAGTRGCTVHRGLPRESMIDPEEVIRGTVLFVEGGNLPCSLAEVRDDLRYLGAPLVAVAGTAGHEEVQRLAPVGADVVLDTTVSDDRILSEVQARCDLQPVPPQLREGVIEPFIQAASLTLREWATTDGVVRAVYQKAMHQGFGPLTAVLRMVSPTGGTLALAFPERTAATLTTRVLARPAEELDQDIIRDCLREVVNVVAGQAKALLLGTPYHFDLSIPTVAVGAGADIGVAPGGKCLVAAIASDGGDFALQLFLPQQGQQAAD
jgi:chemotaxis protein CheX